MRITDLSTRQQNEFARTELENLAERRFEMLSKLVESDPSEVLRVALPDEILEKMPEKLREFFEQREEIRGELKVAVECEENDSRLIYSIKTDDREISAYFSKQPDEKLMTGARVIVKGLRFGNTVVADNSEIENPPSSDAALPNTFGVRKILVLLVNFRDDLTQSYTTDQSNNLIFNSGATKSVTNYYREASYGQTSLAGDTYGYFTLPVNKSSIDCSTMNGPNQIASYAKQAASNAGINLSGYDKFVYVFPSVSGCFSGLAIVGGTDVWINNSLTFATVTHELGHSFGLYHAHRLACGGAVLGTNCSTLDYGNMVDIMGYSGNDRHFYSYHKERLGWLNYGVSPPITTVSQSGVYSISPLAAQDSLPKALKIRKSNGTWYHIEVRRPIGFDSVLSYLYPNSNLTSGVIVTMNDEVDGNKNYQLDMTPETSSWADSALTVGKSYTDSTAGITITPLSVDNSGAVVSVSFGSPPPPPTCVLSNPTISVTPSNTQWIGAGSTVSYSLTVTNNNSSGCTDNNFNVQPAVPAGWSAVTTSPVLSVSPGTSATTTIQVASPTSATDGFYSIGMAASNYSSPAYAASKTVSCAVYSSLGVNAVPSQTAYTRTQTAIVTASVSANGSPMAGARVTFTLTKSNGTKVNASVVSAADGSAVFSYKFNKKSDPAGVYLISANATLNNVSGNGSSSFEVR